MYRYLTTHPDKAIAGKVKWNFQKYLVGRDGAVIAKFGPTTKPESKKIVKAIEEALAVGRARGAPIMPDSLAWAMDSLDRFPGQGRASMAKDFTDQRPVELEGLTGTVVRMGRELDVSTPANDFLYAILKPLAVRIETLDATGS